MNPLSQLARSAPPLCRVAFVLAVTGLLSTATASATPFKLTPLNLGKGYSIGGTVWTDDTAGLLGKRNIKRWGITVTKKTLLKRYTTTNGKTLTTSGINLDGDTLTADFGSLLEPGGSSNLTAVARTAGGNLFDIAPTDFGHGLIVSGTITTDGTSGALTAANLTRWNIVVNEISKTTLTRKNSRLTNILGVTTDNLTLHVERGNGLVRFATLPKAGQPGSTLLLADFRPSFPTGRAGYLDPLTRKILAPLGGAASEPYLLATAILPAITSAAPPQVAPAPVPEPATLLLLGTGLVGLSGMIARKRRAA